MDAERKAEIRRYAETCSSEGVVQLTGPEVLDLLSDSAAKERVEELLEHETALCVNSLTRDSNDCTVSPNELENALRGEDGYG